MLHLLADENLNGKIIGGLRREQPEIDLVTVSSVNLLGAPDSRLLEWAAEQSRVIVSHDKRTLIGAAYQRVRRGLRMKGLIIVHDWCPVAQAIYELALMAGCYEPSEIEFQVKFIPI